MSLKHIPFQGVEDVALFTPNRTFKYLINPYYLMLNHISIANKGREVFHTEQFFFQCVG